MGGAASYDQPEGVRAKVRLGEDIRRDGRIDHHYFMFMVNSSNGDQYVTFRIQLLPNSLPEWQSLLEAHPDAMIGGSGHTSKVCVQIWKNVPHYVLSMKTAYNDVVSAMVPVPWLRPSLGRAIALAVARGALFAPDTPAVRVRVPDMPQAPDAPRVPPRGPLSRQEQPVGPI